MRLTEWGNVGEHCAVDSGEQVTGWEGDRGAQGGQKGCAGFVELDANVLADINSG